LCDRFERWSPMCARSAPPHQLSSRLLTNRVIARSRRWAADAEREKEEARAKEEERSKKEEAGSEEARAKEEGRSKKEVAGNEGRGRREEVGRREENEAGSGRRPRRRRSAEARRKTSRTLKGRRKPPETREKISQALRGHVVSEGTREKLSQAMTGRKQPRKTRAKISATLKGHAVREETREKIRQTNSRKAPRGEAHPSYRHGAYATPTKPVETLEDVIADLGAKQAKISRLLEEELESGRPLSATGLALLTLHSQNAGKLGQLMNYRQKQGKKGEDDELKRAMDQALDELSKELGLEL
jgi:hypothetical protein